MLLVDVDDMLQLLEEPLVNLGQVVNALDGVALVHSLCDDEHTLVGRLSAKLSSISSISSLLVLYEAVHALTNHTKTLLDSLLESCGR